jgi:pimeloyl-ACP methyl ester carboxylesterase
MRGRGRSAYAPDAMSYTPVQYVQDVLALLDQAGIARVVAIGTSLGGLMTMGLAMQYPQRLAGAVLNDVGPVLEPEGLANIASYLGTDPRFASWEEGAKALRATYARTFPLWQQADWLAMAHRVMVPDSDAAGDGAIRFDYDPRIAVPFFAGSDAPLPDLWPGLEALGAGPLLVLRGALSDILSAETLAEMTRRAPGMQALTLPDIGHPLTLDEPAAVAAILRLLDKVR